MRNLSSLPIDDRQKYKDLANLELETMLNLDKRYTDKIKEVRYKELLGIEEIPELDLREKEKQQEDFNFQIQMLFQNLLPFFSTQQNLREYVQNYVKTVEKAFFINSNIEVLRKKLEDVTNLDPSIFEAFIQDLFREEDGFTGVTDREYQQRFKNYEDELKALRIYQTDPDIKVVLNKIKSEFTKENQSVIKKEKLLTSLRRLVEETRQNDETQKDTDDIDLLMQHLTLNPDDDVSRFPEIDDEISAQVEEKLIENRLINRFESIIKKLKELDIYKKDEETKLTIDLYIDKYKKVDTNLKEKYLERLESLVRQYSSEDQTFMNPMSSKEQQEDTKRQKDFIEEEEKQRMQDEKDSAMEITDLNEERAIHLQRILKFYYSYDKRGPAGNRDLKLFVIENQNEDDIITDSEQKIRDSAPSSKFQKKLKEIKKNVDTFCGIFKISYEQFYNVYIKELVLPFRLLKYNLYDNLDGSLGINLDFEEEEMILDLNDDIIITKAIAIMNDLIEPIKKGIRHFMKSFDEKFKIELLKKWSDILFRSIIEKVPSVSRQKFDDAFQNITDSFFREDKTTKGNSILTVGRQRVLVGRGILPIEKEPLYSNFGKFLIHNRSLKEDSKLNIKFPSMASHPKFKKEKISETFRNLLLNLLETNQLSNELYNQLNSEEKETFDRLAYFSGIKEKIGSGIYSREKEEHKEFELLKYQILSGNNSRKGLEKFKKLINKFVKENKINKDDSKGLLEHINEILAINSD